MFKKIILVFVCVVLLGTVEFLYAMKRSGLPQAKQSEVQKGNKYSETEVEERERLEEQERDEMEALERMEQRGRGGRRRGYMNRQKSVGSTRGELDGHLEKLIDAYREKDREKMGQVIRQINQFRQKMREGGEGRGMRRDMGWSGRGVQRRDTAGRGRRQAMGKSGGWGQRALSDMRGQERGNMPREGFGRGRGRFGGRFGQHGMKAMRFHGFAAKRGFAASNWHPGLQRGKCGRGRRAFRNIWGCNRDDTPSWQGFGRGRSEGRMSRRDIRPGRWDDQPRQGDDW